MNNLLRTIGNALLLDDQAFARIRDARDNFARGLVIVVAISLIVGLFNSLFGFLNAVRTTPEAQLAQARTGVEQAFEQMGNMGVFGPDPTMREQTLAIVETAFDIAETVAGIVEETTPLPHPVASFFQTLGGWLSYPFGWVSRWMLYGVVVLVFAKLLGGTASIREMLSTTSLVAVPHLLDAFRFVPVAGFLLGLLAFVWGVVVYVKGTAVANRFGVGRALLAVLAPILFLVGLAILVLIALIVALVAAGGGR